MTKANLLALALSVLAATMITSCVEKRGCTSTYADNYDPDATQDDDTCVPTRDKFVGQFEANGTIEIAPDTLVPYDDVWINIEDSTVASQDGMILKIVGIDPTYQILPLDAVTSGMYSINIVNQTIDNITYYGDGLVNGRVLELNITRDEEVTLPDESVVIETTYLNIYGIKEIE
jgi:hypothetical protein